MKKKVKKSRVYVELTAVWGNDNAESTIKVSRRRWKSIRAGAAYQTSALSWYPGGHPNSPSDGHFKIPQ